MFSHGMLDADPPGRLLVPCLLVDGDLLSRCVLGRFARRGMDLIGERRGQPPVALVEGDLDMGMLAEQVSDPLGLDGGLIVHPAGPHRATPQRPALLIGDDGGLDSVLLALARDERPPADPVRPWTADLRLGGVDAELDAAGGGVGDRPPTS
jgi:hypothetical protein